MAGRGVVTISRQVLEVDLHGTEADGHALQRRLPGVCADVVSPVIESALGHLDPGDGYLFLERLSIDLTLSSLERLEANLADAIRHELAEHFRRRPVPAATDPAGALGRDEVQHRSQREATGDALVTFLRTGGLPWWFRLPQGRTLEEVIVATWPDIGGHRDPPTGTKRLLLEVLIAQEVRQRLVRQFTPAFVEIVLRSLSPEVAVAVAGIESRLGGWSAPGAAHRFGRHVFEVALATVVAARPESSPATLVRAALAQADPPVRADLGLVATLEREWPGSTRAEKQPAEAATILRPQPTPAPPRADEPAEQGGVMVENAGLVLLQPFLPRFFEGLGVAAGDDLIDPSRALCLLHHLATAELTAPEHRLVLAKVLCGVPEGEPVEADVGLTAEETTEATALLTAAIGHWDALRGTSPDALRLEFLQRPGVLSVTGDGDWLLRVDGRTVDILLDQLPWGYASFRLPWMSRLMMVEWR